MPRSTPIGRRRTCRTRWRAACRCWPPLPTTAATQDRLRTRPRTTLMNIQAATQRTNPPFHGILDNEGRVVSNWGQHRTHQARGLCRADQLRRRAGGGARRGRFPTPVNPVGSIASVTDTIVNDGGTMVCLRKLDEVLGLERDATGPPGGAGAGRLPAQEAQHVAAGARRRNPVPGRDRRGDGRLGRGRRHQGILARRAGLFLGACGRAHLRRRQGRAAHAVGSCRRRGVPRVQVLVRAVRHRGRVPARGAAGDAVQVGHFARDVQIAGGTGGRA